jgi:outer membrane protein OmpU
MKKVLLATTALTLSAGFASAEVVMSGTGGAGVFGDKGADLSVYSGVDLGFALTGSSDTGMEFSASIDMGAGQTLDAGDFELDTQDMGTDTKPTITVVASGVTVTLAQDGIDDLYDDDPDPNGVDMHSDIGISGAMGDLTYSIVTGLEDADPTSLSIGYTAGAITGSVVTSDAGDASTVNVSYKMGDITVAAESDTDRAGADTSSITVTYAMADGMTVSLENSEDVNTLGVTYSSGAISVAVEADDATAETWEATMAYDLGSGATFNLGTDESETTFAGVGFSF